jgi:hypothetical protein
MSAVSDLVLDLVWLCSMYKASRFFDLWVGLLLVLDQEGVVRVESGIQNSYPHRFDRIENRIHIAQN